MHLFRSPRLLLRALWLLGFLGSRLAMGQNVGSGQPTGTPANTVSSVKHGGVAASLSYGSNSSFFGRTQTTRYPYTSGELTYKTRAGGWGSVVANNLLDTTLSLTL